MAAIIPNEAEVRILEARVAISPQRYILFNDNITPDADTVFADLTEPTWPGYGRQTPTWGAVTTGGDGRAVVVGVPLVFVRTSTGAPQTAYGWAHIDSSAGDEKILAIALFSSPVVIENVGDGAAVVPTMHERQQA